MALGIDFVDTPAATASLIPKALPTVTLSASLNIRRRLVRQAPIGDSSHFRLTQQAVNG
jgi:hypothetical protein